MTITLKLRSVSLCKAGALAAFALAATLLAPASHAQVTLLTDPMFLTPGGTPVALTGAPGSSVSDPYVLTPSGGMPTVTFSNNALPGNANSFNRDEQPGPGFGGLAGTDFLPGTQLLRNVVAGNDPLSGLTITFSQGVSEVGLNYDPTVSFVSTDFTFNVFQAGNPVATTFTIPNVVNGNLADGSEPFFGVQSATNNITSIVISGFRAGGDGNDFFIGDNFTPADPNGNYVNAMTLFRMQSVPEPGTLALLMGAGLPIGLLALRRRR